MTLRHEDVDLRSNEFGAKPSCLIERRTFHPAGIDRDGLSLNVTKRIEAALADSARRLKRAHEVASLDQRLATLTPREREVMELVIAGHYNKVIADELGIVPRTVEFFRARIFDKMGVKSAIELASLLASRDRLRDR